MDVRLPTVLWGSTVNSKETQKYYTPQNHWGPMVHLKPPTTPQDLALETVRGARATSRHADWLHARTNTEAIMTATQKEDLSQRHLMI